MSIMLHVDAKPLTREDLAKFDTPEATRTWDPISHIDALDMALAACKRQGLEAHNVRLGATEDGMRAFGEIDFGEVGVAGDVKFLGIFRNAIDKSRPLVFGFGSTCFVCDNGAFHCELQAQHKHTANVRARMPERLDEAVAKWFRAKGEMTRRIDAWKSVELTNDKMALAIMRTVESGGLTSSRAGMVWEEWRKPSFPEFAKRNVWSGYNAFTHIAKGRKASLDAQADTALKLDQTFARLFPVAAGESN